MFPTDASSLAFSLDSSGALGGEGDPLLGARNPPSLPTAAAAATSRPAEPISSPSPSPSPWTNPSPLDFLETPGDFSEEGAFQETPTSPDGLAGLLPESVPRDWLLNRTHPNCKVHLVREGTPAPKAKEFSPSVPKVKEFSDEQTYLKYISKRQRNNAAANKSRNKRREIELATLERAKVLEVENAQLKKELHELRIKTELMEKLFGSLMEGKVSKPL